MAEEGKGRPKRGVLLDSIKGYDKTSLKNTDTRVLTVRGEEYMETKDSEGRIVRKNPDEKLVVGWVITDMQVGEVLPGLLIGSQDVALDLETLQKYKVTHVLNLATNVKNAFPEKFKYNFMQILDSPDADITVLFDGAFEFIDEGRKNDGCVLVHCNMGVSRSATIVIAYLMNRKGMTLQDAQKLVKEKRPAIRPNLGFQTQLKAYDETLKTHNNLIYAHTT